jgi:hypothetical protein
MIPGTPEWPISYNQCKHEKYRTHLQYKTGSFQNLRNEKFVDVSFVEFMSTDADADFLGAIFYLILQLFIPGAHQCTPDAWNLECRSLL